MFKKIKPRKWTDRYLNHIERNIGLITLSDQEKLRKTPLAVLGVGGLGGPLAEQLVRCGCEQLVICDNETYEPSNLNRQICTTEDLGKFKVDVIENYLKKINPDANIQKYYEITDINISEVLRNVAIVTLTLDDPITSIIIARECKKKKIPMLESWGVPYLCAWWFTSDSMDYETCFDFNTNDKSIKQILDSKNEFLNIFKVFSQKVLLFPGLKKTYEREIGTFEAMINGEIGFRSFAPIIRLNASYLGFELIFTGLLKIKPMILAPRVIGYDYLRMKPIEFNFK